MSCTSKWRWPSARRAASRESAKASKSSSSSDWPFWTSCFIRAVSRGKSSSSSARIFGSSSLMRAIFGHAFLSSRSFLVPMIFFRVQSIMSLQLSSGAPENPR